MSLFGTGARWSGTRLDPGAGYDGGVSPLVSFPPASVALRAAALDELRGALEAIRCGAWLAARGRVTQRELRLLVAIDMAAERAERAVQRLAAAITE